MGVVGRIIGGIVLVGAALLLGPATPFAIFGYGMTAAGAAAYGALGASLLLGGISQALQRRPGIGRQGRELSYRTVAAFRAFVYGRARIGGNQALLHLHGTNNEFFKIVLALGDGGPDGCEEWSALYFGDEEVTFSTHPFNTIVSATGKYANHVRVQVQAGDDNPTAFSMLTTDIPSIWTSAHQGKGVMAVAIELKHNRELFKDFSLEQVKFQIKGRKCLDPRTGTIAYTENPPLIGYDYLRAKRRGLRWTDRDQQQQFPGDKFFEYKEAIADWKGVWGDRQVSAAGSGTVGGGIGSSTGEDQHRVLSF